MKVLIISGSYPKIKCGVGDYTYILANKLSENADVTVLTSTDAKSFEGDRVTVKNVVKKWSGLYIIKTILKEIKTGGYDVVHIQFPTVKYKRNSIANYIILPFLLRLKGVKVVYTLHEYSNNSKLSKAVRIPAILCSNRIVIVDNLFLDELSKKFRRRKDKIRYINIGANVERSTANEEDINALRESLKKGDEKLLAHFGFVNHSKRLDLILKAMAELKRENNLKSRLVIVGDFSQERCGKELYSELTDIIKENGLEDNITVTGYIEGNVGDYFRASDSAIMLFSNGVSVRNGSVLAGQQEGVKIITSKPVRKIDVFKEQFYFVDNEVDSVKRAIEIVQNEDRKTYPLGDDFSWDAIRDKHLSVYNELINR